MPAHAPARSGKSSGTLVGSVRLHADGFAERRTAATQMGRAIIDKNGPCRSHDHSPTKLPSHRRPKGRLNRRALRNLVVAAAAMPNNQAQCAICTLRGGSGEPRGLGERLSGPLHVLRRVPEDGNLRESYSEPEHVLCLPEIL